MEPILHKWGDFFSAFVDARGEAGALGLLWEKTVHVRSFYTRLIRLMLSLDGKGRILTRDSMAYSNGKRLIVNGK